MLASGMQLGPYEIRAPLGAGGMGEVYRAKDSRLDRDVAIKVLPTQFAQDAARLARFEREAKAVAALSHPNILAIHDYGTEQGHTFAVMELLEGETLRGRITCGAIPCRKSVEIAVAIADGLSAAHAKGIIHRDLKPENIFLTSDDWVKVLDFGLARIEPLTAPSGDTPTGSFQASPTEVGAILGTVGYMSPEQVRAQGVDGRSDVFSLGCVLFEMVHGERAFARPSSVETLAAILHDEPLELTASDQSVPIELDRIIRHCLEKNREARFQSARDVAFALRAMLSDSSVSSARAITAGETRKPVAFWLLTACAVLALAAASAWLIAPWFRDGTATTKATKPEKSAAPEMGIQSVAVLPFENVGGYPAMEYLSDGIADYLCIRLSRVRDGGLRVTPFTSVSRYRGAAADIRAAGHDLGVSRVVTGKVAQDGDHLSVSVAVIDARDGSLVWGEQYHRPRAAILDLQDAIVRDVTARLRPELTDEQEQRLIRRDTADAEAYLLYREGRHRLAKMMPADLRDGIRFFQQAVEKDPQYALAYCGLADCHIALGMFFIEPKKAFPLAKQALAQALRLDDTLAEAHVALASVLLFYDWQWVAAEREVRHGLRLNPDLPDAYQAYGNYLAVMGRREDAIQQFQRAEELDPLGPIRSSDLAWACILAGRYEEALRHARRALEIDPNFYPAYCNVAIALTELTRYAEADQAARKSIALVSDNPCPRALLGYNYARWGKRAEALQALGELTGLEKQGRFVSGFEPAMVYSALGELDAAFGSLRKSFDERFVYLVFFRFDPTLIEMRPDPRFAKLVHDLGLP